MSRSGSSVVRFFSRSGFVYSVAQTARNRGRKGRFSVRKKRRNRTDIRTKSTEYLQFREKRWVLGTEIRFFPHGVLWSEAAGDTASSPLVTRRLVFPSKYNRPLFQIVSQIRPRQPVALWQERLGQTDRCSFTLALSTDCAASSSPNVMSKIMMISVARRRAVAWIGC